MKRQKSECSESEQCGVGSAQVTSSGMFWGAETWEEEYLAEVISVKGDGQHDMVSQSPAQQELAFHVRENTEKLVWQEHWG